MDNITSLYNQLRQDNVQLRQLLIDKNKRIASLEREIEAYRNEISHLITSNLMELTFEQFKMFLNTPFTIDTMPRVGGIYAYYNERKDLLYIGQSVDMNKRLKQHFNNAKKGKHLKINGHDSEFTNLKEWQFYVLEYIDRNDKPKLDEREAYWIALAKVATSNKIRIDRQQTDDLLRHIKRNDLEYDANDFNTSEIIHEKGKVTNRTRGNHVRM